MKTTLFMLISVDGKISTGKNDNLDFDKDLPRINGVKEGLNQYYKLEKQTDLCSLNTGRVMKKIGMNKSKKNLHKIPVKLIIIDNKSHLNKTGINNLLKKYERLFLVTKNERHIAFKIKDKNLITIYYDKKINFKHLFKILEQKYKINKLTIQSGGTLNSHLLRNNLIDSLSLVIAPCLVGGKDTPSLIGGDSINSIKELKLIKSLRLKSCKKLKNSYLHIKYDLMKNENKN